MRRIAIATTVTAALLATTLAACAGTGTGTVDGTVSDGTVVTDDTLTGKKDDTFTPDDDDEDVTEDDGTYDDEDDEDAKGSKKDSKKDSKKSTKKDEADDEDADDADHEAAVKAAKAEGKTVLTGTVVMVDGPDIFDYEDIDPSVMGGAQSEAGNTYAILELDEETTISGMGADGFAREETHDLIGLGHDLPKYDEIKDTASQWKKYDGQRVCVAGNAVFPTDVSFPTAGTLHDAELLYVEAVG